MIRLGRISYVNMAPVFYRLDARRRGGAGRADRAEPAPARRASSTSRRSRRSSTRATPTGCGSCRGSASRSEGAVDSIQLVSRKPLEQVRSVAVTPESATSVVLTKVLLPEAEHVPLDEEADAKLLIGDAALQVGLRGPDAALRPRPAVARADRPADGLRRLGLPRADRAPGSPSSRTRSSRSVRARARRARAARARGERALRLSGRLPRALLREAALLVRPARARRA